MLNKNLNENPDILFEKRDTDTPAVTTFLIWMLVVTFATSLLMIPLTKYLWNHTDQTRNHTLASNPTPGVVLEIIPNQELEKMKAETLAAQDDEKIKKAMEEALKQSFAVRKS